MQVNTIVFFRVPKLCYTALIAADMDIDAGQADVLTLLNDAL